MSVQSRARERGAGKQGPVTFAEVIITFRKEATKNIEGERVQVFRNAVTGWTSTNSNTILRVQEMTDDREQHYFHWSDVASMKQVPARVSLVEA